MNEGCNYYQQNEQFMAVLSDCAVVALTTGCFELQLPVLAVCKIYQNAEREYFKTQTFIDQMIPHRILTDDLVHTIADTSRSAAHGNRNGRPSTAPPRTAPGPATKHALLELQALMNKF